jgi:hypothetical protein
MVQVYLDVRSSDENPDAGIGKSTRTSEHLYDDVLHIRTSKGVHCIIRNAIIGD